jgi:4-amino-4-deoxy-L-arabinose transferase-like glycosyltransferase
MFEKSMMLSKGLTGDALSASARPTSAWREIELLLLAALVVGVYFTRLTDLTIRGEESRWARVAQEMIDTGDWIVPRQQFQPFPDRPPLNSWAMILASRMTGQLNLAAVRLPTVMATLLTTLIIYLYSRNFLSRFGSLAAAASYPTMAQVLQLGRLGESDALMTLCVAASLFSWHWRYERRHDPRLAWTLGYSAAALAGLCKGPQGPVYFVAATTILLCLRRDWRFLLSPWHAVGLIGFAGILGAWQLPFYWELDAASAKAIWSEGGEFSERFDYSNMRRVIAHWFGYPFEIFVCILPWSLALLVLPSHWLRARMGAARPMVAFLLTALAFAFLTCWAPAQSRSRYFMSLYPCFAPLVGLVLDRCREAHERTWWQRTWDRYLVGGSLLMTAAAAVIILTRIWSGPRLAVLGQAVSGSFAIAYVLLTAVAVAVVLWTRFGQARVRAHAGVLALAGFMGFTYTGVVVNMQMAFSNNPADSVASIREIIPEGERLVSFGKVHHLFAYYYGQPIELLKLGQGEAAMRMPGSYFCFAIDPGFVPPKIPFPWECVAEISCERARSDRPLTKVVVGRYTPADFKTAEAELSSFDAVVDGPDTAAATRASFSSPDPATRPAMPATEP